MSVAGSGRGPLTFIRVPAVEWNMAGRIRRALSRARYAAIGGAIGGAVGGMVSRNAASSGAALGALAGAFVGETRVSAEERIDELKEVGEESVGDIVSD